MLGSMYSAVSGLQAHQTKMNVIGNNIANVNTYGFKASRVTFSDVFYQTMNGASAPTTNGGGTNPTQLGYGAKVNSIDVINTRAGSATTDRALDVYINGEGYLPVKDNDGVVKYTRVGVLSFDEAGNLVDRNGNMVLGFQLDSTTKNPQMGTDGTTNVQNLVPIKVAPAELEKYTGVSIGQNGEITAVREGDPELSAGITTGWIIGVNGNVPATTSYRGDITVTSATASNDAKLVTSYAGNSISTDANIAGDIKVSYNASATPNPQLVLSYHLKGESASAAYHTATVDWDGSTTGPLTFAGIEDNHTPAGTAGTVTLEVGGTDGVPVTDLTAATAAKPVTIGTAVPSSVTVNISVPTKAGTTETLTQTWNAGDTTLDFGNGISFKVNPSAFGTLDVSKLPDSIIGTVGNGAGVPLKIAHLANVKFLNPDGLEQDGDGYCVETTNSGEPVATIPGSDGTGNFRAGALEMSNVDLSREFTEMIITQRGFQANTRMITTSDEMLSELVNMKR